jgi:hypothetical protein
MPDPPPEPIILAVLKARMKEANAAAPAGIERVKASAVNAAVVAAARDEESRCPGSSGSTRPADPSSSAPTGTPARPLRGSFRPASPPGTCAPLLRQAAYGNEVRGCRPYPRERIAA